MDRQIDALNKRQLESKRPVINKEKTHFEWEDTSLLSLLCNGLPTLYPKSVSKENQVAEQEAICIANNLLKEANKELDYSKFEEDFDGLISSYDGYIYSRLEELKLTLINDAKARKGLLVYGEGGIGKTYFLYELAQSLASKQRPYVVAFNQEGVIRLSEFGLQQLRKSYPNGFTLILDACNELDIEGFKLAHDLILKTLETDNASVVVTTRSESPTSRMNELQTLLPTSIEFQGVNPDYAFSVLAECADEIIIQYQDMLFSRNPRNLNAMLAMIRDFRPNEDGRNATTQRTALIEKCIKDSLSKQQWNQTKKLCRFLLDAGTIGFSKNNANSILGKEADSYLSDMIEQGFIECYDYDNEGAHYYYSSESQIRCVIARCLNDEFNRFNNCVYSEDELIDNIARLVAEKSFYSNDYEMIQVAVDRYVIQGPIFLSKLLKKLEQLDLRLDWERLLTQTIFPLSWNFKGFVNVCRVDADWAFLHFSGISNTPFNLTNYTNDIFMADESLVDEFFVNKWERWALQPIISRVQNITDFVSHTNRVPAAAKTEWVWLSIWCSFSSDMTLRALSQRLMFFLCNSDDEALREIIGAWQKVQDIFARRAITKAISHLDKETRYTEVIKQFFTEIINDEDVVDSIIIANACRATEGRVTPIDFSAKNVYIELEGCKPTEKDLENFKHHADIMDLIHKNYFPFDIYQMQKGYIDFHYSGRFISTPLEIINAWNDSLRNLLSCQPDGECKGWLMHENDFRDFLPIEFEKEPLDQQRLMSCMVFLTKSWLERYGGNLQDLLGEFKSLNPYRDTYITPNMKPFDLASHELLGSLASNYYIDEIILDGEGRQRGGFCQYDEQAYNEPGVIHACAPTSNSNIDLAKPKIERRIVSPEDKNRAWFDDKDEAFSEILGLTASVRIGKTDWQPIAFSAKNKIRLGTDLLCSNEFVISIAFDPNQHINGGQDDRYLTIEHKSFEGNIRDFEREEGDLCLTLEAPDTHCVVTERNQILLPPPSLIRQLKLLFDPRNACFIDKNSGDIIIACDGSPGNYYEEPVHNLTLMRKDVYDELIQNEVITFFAFSERFHKDSGYGNDCDRHWEFRPDGTLIADYPNGGGIEHLTTSGSCQNCYFSSDQRRERQNENDFDFDDPAWLKEIMDNYKVSSD